MEIYWWDILVILYNILISRFYYKKHINPKTAKEYDHYTNGVYTNTRMHYSERKSAATLIIIFFWTIGWWFIRTMVYAFIS